MSKLILLVVLLAAAAVLSVDARQKRKYFKEKKCIIYRTLKCRYRTLCVERGQTCGNEVIDRNQCVEWKVVHHDLIGAKCVKTVWDIKCGPTKTKVPRCTEWSQEVKPHDVKTCAKYGDVKRCTFYKTVCTKKEKMKRCYVVDHRPHVYGPTKCTKKNHQLKFKKMGNNVKRYCKYVPANQVNPAEATQQFCTMFPDPHARHFDGSGSEFQVAGDFQVYLSSTALFNVHIRQVRWNGWGWTGMTATAVLINGIDIVKVYAKNKVIELNGDAASVVNRVRKNLDNGGYVFRQDNRVEIGGLEGEKYVVNLMDTVWGGADWMFGSIEMYSSKSQADQSKGVCVKHKDRFIPVGGLFNRRFHATDVAGATKPKTFDDDAAEKNAKVLCHTDGGIPLNHHKHMKQCVMDLKELEDPVQRARVLRLHKQVEESRTKHKEKKRLYKLAKRGGK